MGNIFKKYECFGIDISVVNPALDLESNKRTIRRQDVGSRLNIEDPKVINADPFLFVRDGKLFLFYEEATFRRPGGRIMMVSTDDLKRWSKPIQISQEDNLHFSFPYVFEDYGDVYMIPETGWVGEIRLYKALNRELTRFELDSVLMRREKKDENIIFDFADNVLYRKDRVYYLFTSILDKDGYKLQLHTSSELRGPYKEHPSSPICHNLKYGRNAGSLIELHGKLFRPTQDCTNTYGGQVNIMEITLLSPDKYTEIIAKEHILPSSFKFYRQGGHQLNFVEFNGQTVVATDAKRDRCFPAVRIADKMKRIFGLKNSQ